MNKPRSQPKEGYLPAERNWMAEPLGMFQKCGRLERRRILAIQRWIVALFEKALAQEQRAKVRRIKALKYEHNKRMTWKNSQDLLEAYMSGQISDKEYKKAHRKLQSAAVPDEQVHTDRIVWLEVQLQEQRGLVAEMERINKVCPPGPSRTSSKAYDPRKNISKYNVLPERFNETQKQISEIWKEIDDERKNARLADLGDPNDIVRNVANTRQKRV